jgi:hypothetical protein
MINADSTNFGTIIEANREEYQHTLFYEKKWVWRF